MADYQRQQTSKENAAPVEIRENGNDVNLAPKCWKHWEQICCHLMRNIAKREWDVDVFFDSYGSQGQSQFGIDIVPRESGLPFVAQCKLLERSFTWSDALKEVAKTDKYSNKIRRYVIFTTANVHTTIQDQRNRDEGKYLHTRPNGSQFTVEVIYWSEIRLEDLIGIPPEDLREFFGDAFKLVAQSEGNAVSEDEYLKSLDALRANLPKWISGESLEWLNTWDFGSGYVREMDFRPFFDLYIEHNRTVSIPKGEAEHLKINDRALIKKCLPAGNGFFNALDEFYMAILSHTIGQNRCGMDILTLAELAEDLTFNSKETNRWKRAAELLVRRYREDVLGEYLEN